MQEGPGPDGVRDEEEDVEGNENAGNIISSIGINTEAVQVASRGTDVMTLSSSTQVNMNLLNIGEGMTGAYDKCGLDDGTKATLSPIKLENPIVESLDMLQSLISKVTNEKNVLHRKKLDAISDHGRVLGNGSDCNVKMNIADGFSTENVNGIIKNLINTVENERSRIASLRLGV